MGKSGSGQTETRPVESVLKEARLRHVCRSAFVLAGRRTPLREVIHNLQAAEAGVVLVTEQDGKLAGVFTERDYLDKVALKQGRSPGGLDPHTQVEALMTPSPRTLSAEHTLSDAIRVMTEGGYRHIPLVEADGRIVGVLSANDAVHYIAEHFPAEVFNLPPHLHQRIRSREGG